MVMVFVLARNLVRLPLSSYVSAGLIAKIIGPELRNIGPRNQFLVS